MNYRPFLEQDYPMYAEWLLDHSRPVPDLKSLPAYGIVVEGDEPLAIGFLFDCKTNYCVVGNLASNKKAKQRSEGVNFLIETLCTTAKDKGYDTVLMSTFLPKLIERLKKINFEVLEENMTHLGRKL